MRIVTIFLALLLSLPAFVSEAGLTVAQKAMRTKMVTFLKEEGYMPEITEEGSIKFKIEGIIYFITLDERDTIMAMSSLATRWMRLSPKSTSTRQSR